MSNIKGGRQTLIACLCDSAHLPKLAPCPSPLQQSDHTRAPGAGAPVEGHLQLDLVLLGQLPDAFLKLRDVQSSSKQQTTSLPGLGCGAQYQAVATPHLQPRPKHAPG